MTFHKPSRVLGPVELAAVTAAFELALREILDGAHLDLPAHELRRRIAAAVMAEAQNGVIDPEALKEAGLKSLSGLSDGSGGD